MMKIIQILGGSALVLALVTCGSCGAFAEESAESGVALQSTRDNSLQEAISRAENVKTNDYTAKLGLDNYLKEKLDLADDVLTDGTAEEKAEMAKVLDDAVKATELLYSRSSKTTETTTPSKPATGNSNTVAQVTPKPVVSAPDTGATTIQVVVTDNKADDKTTSQNSSTIAETKTDAKENTENTAVDDTAKESTPEEAVELPNTGETSRASVVTLIVAGVAVVAATAGISAVLLKAKRNR